MIRAFQWDLARQVERLDWLTALLPRYADWGYQELYLHLEDALRYPSLPGIGRADAYPFAALEALVAAAGRVGIRVVPIVNLLGHTDYLIRVPEFRDLNELRAPDGSPLPRGQVCPLHPRLPELARALIRDVRPLCTAGKVHVGLDESYNLGRHPLSRAEVAEVGLAGHFARHVHRLHALAQEQGLRLGMWADMLALLPEAIPLLPAGIAAYDWYYYPFDRLPRLEPRNFAPYDLAGPLRRQGIAYWGCPMNGAFRHEPLPVFGERIGNVRSWWNRCSSVGAEGFLVTSWEPNRLALEMTTVVDAAAAGLWLDSGVEDAPGLLARGFERVYGPRRKRRPGARGGSAGAAPGERARAWARAALGCDAWAFAGYARWEINDRWDVCAVRGARAVHARALAHHKRLLRQPGGFPTAFRASVRLGRTLAARDLFVRQSAADVLALRRLAVRRGSTHPDFRAALAALARETRLFAREITAGRAAARTMWLATREAAAAPAAPNERLLEADAARLKGLRDWLRSVGRRPPAGPGKVPAGHPLFAAGPLCGAWQLRFCVLSIEPAIQKVIVERATGDGGGGTGDAWSTLHSRFTIEFRAAAARPKTSIRREFSVPVGGPQDRLRIAVRGLGRVAVTDVELTDGLTVLRPRDWPARRRRLLGKKAPAREFPAPDWEENTGAVLLRWPPQNFFVTEA